MHAGVTHFSERSEDWRRKDERKMRKNETGWRMCLTKVVFGIRDECRQKIVSLASHLHYTAKAISLYALIYGMIQQTMERYTSRLHLLSIFVFGPLWVHVP